MGFFCFGHRRVSHFLSNFCFKNGRFCFILCYFRFSISCLSCRESGLSGENGGFSGIFSTQSFRNGGFSGIFSTQGFRNGGFSGIFSSFGFRDGCAGGIFSNIRGESGSISSIFS
ncbi:hypothetical protein BGP_6369 [Beggiatoa sp. PS]|nr:hypothetical protein BGP_6369 [Beggiatoa sp. PS]